MASTSPSLLYPDEKGAVESESSAPPVAGLLHEVWTALFRQGDPRPLAALATPRAGSHLWDSVVAGNGSQKPHPASPMRLWDGQ